MNLPFGSVIGRLPQDGIGRLWDISSGGCFRAEAGPDQVCGFGAPDAGVDRERCLGWVGNRAGLPKLARRI